MLLRRDLLFAFEDFAKTLAASCNYSTKVVSSPIRVINNNHYVRFIYLSKNYIYDDINLMFDI